MTTLNNVEQLKRDIEDKQGEIATAQSNIETFEHTCTDKEFDDFLDDCYSEIEIMGMTYNVSYALKELDPTAYRCAKSDYEADFDLNDVEEYQAFVASLDELESQLDELQSQLDDLESED